jgi:hypothetical protein
MATNEQIREGLAVRLETISGLNVYRKAPGSITVPAAVVRRRQTQYDVTLDGADDTTWGITLFVQFANLEVAHEALDAYLDTAGASSIVAAVHADPTLAGVVDFARVASAEGERVINYAGIDYLSVEFVVEVGD